MEICRVCVDMLVISMREMIVCDCQKNIYVKKKLKKKFEKSNYIKN